MKNVILWTAILTFGLCSCSSIDLFPRPTNQAEYTCPVTSPNGSQPPGESTVSEYYHGNGSLWVALWPEGKIIVPPDMVLPDGRLSMKFPWWRGVAGRLEVTGRRLDEEAPPLEAEIPDGYGDSGFQAGGLIFPSEGCWEITGKIGEASLSFATLVVKE